VSHVQQLEETAALMATVFQCKRMLM